VFLGQLILGFMTSGRLPPPLTVIRADVMKRGVNTHAPQFQKQGIFRFPEIAAQPIAAVNASCSPIHI